MASADSSSVIKLKTVQNNPYIKVFSPKNVLRYIRNTSDKPRVVIFSSFDKACKSCDSANRAFYQLSKMNKLAFEFVFVNTNPWRAKELETSLVFRLKNNSPVTVVLYGTKILRKLVGANYQKMPKYLAAAQQILAKNRLSLYGDKLGNGKINTLVISDKFDKFLNKYLNSKDDYKALAVALGKRNGWTASQKVGYLSQEAANYQALKKCSDRWQVKGKTGQCKLYMMSNQYVYNKSEAELKATIASLTGLPTRMDKHILKLKKKSNNKALAYAVNKYGNWTSSIVYNQKSERNARSAVLKSCERQRIIKKLNKPCKLYFVNDKFIGDRRGY